MKQQVFIFFKFLLRILEGHKDLKSSRSFEQIILGFDCNCFELKTYIKYGYPDSPRPCKILTTTAFTKATGLYVQLLPTYDGKTL